MKTFYAVFTIAASVASAVLGSQPANAEVVGDPRGVVVEEVRNDHPSFLVRVDVDRPERTYTGGDEMRVSVVSARNGYLYLLYCDAGGNVSCLFPNAFGEDNRIVAMRPVVVPQPPRADRSSFRLRIGPPYGQEVLKAIVSLKPLDASALGQLMSEGKAQARLAGVRAVYVEETKAADWAEHHVKIVTRDPLPAPAPDRQTVGAASTRLSDNIVTNLVVPGPTAEDGPRRRVGVFIGVSQYADKRIRDLSVCAKDAITMAKVMKGRGHIGQGWVLTDEQATRRNIEHVLRRQVPAATRPGDSVMIYWSGHGSRCADDGGDEQDGFDEYLVPHDGRLDNVETVRNTMILDDTFGRWIQELDGRRVVVVLDTCHSGGQTYREKSIERDAASAADIAAENKRSHSKFGGWSRPGFTNLDSSVLGRRLTGEPSRDHGMTNLEARHFDFLDGEFSRIKDIGQRDTALLASSSARQVSFERKEGDLSTMTYFLVEHLKSSDGPITLSEAYSYLQQRVSRYVEENFPGTTQSPVLINDLAGPFYLRP